MASFIFKTTDSFRIHVEGGEVGHYGKQSVALPLFTGNPGVASGVRWRLPPQDNRTWLQDADARSRDQGHHSGSREWVLLGCPGPGRHLVALVLVIGVHKPLEERAHEALSPAHCPKSWPNCHMSQIQLLTPEKDDRQ